jgi:hypothetical protein
MNLDFIKRYLEGELSDDIFFEGIYKDQELQNILEHEKDIPPYTNEGSLLQFLLIGGNAKKLEFIIDVKDVLRQFLVKKNVKFIYSEKSNDIYNILLKYQPKWLDINPEYFSTIIKNYNGKNKKEIKEEIREKIKNDFIYMKNPPKWLQSPNWPIENGQPLIFIGELDMGELLHDMSKVFIFYNKAKDTFSNIKQSC